MFTAEKRQEIHKAIEINVQNFTKLFEEFETTDEVFKRDAKERLIEEYERAIFLYLQTSAGHEKIMEMVNQDKSLQEISKVAHYHCTLEGV